LRAGVLFTIYAQAPARNLAVERNLKSVEKPSALQKHTGGTLGLGVQLPIDPARVLDRQVISGEVTGGLALATGRGIGIGLTSVGPKLRAEIA
jgi:hypothetical protein